MLQLVSWAILILAAGGILGWAMRHRPAAAGLAGAAGCVIGGGVGLYGAVSCLLLRQFESRRELWNVPHGSLGVGLDSLSALFLIPVFFVGAMAALAALRRLPGDYAANRPHEHWLFLNLTLAGAALTVVARNGVLFLFAWELMTVSSFLLIENDQRDASARGGWVYLTAGHIGGACLFAMFALLGLASGSLDFNGLRAAGGVATAVFLLGFAGFGGKIGLAPFQTWYPESYPQAPAHVGAVLSGVVGNLGVYGLLRLLFILGDGGALPPAWWGFLLLFAGLASAVIGAARSLASRDLSRLLAWSSAENFGLMAAGVGAGLLGTARGDGTVALLGFSAAIFHMLNHSVSKALLFLAAGTVYVRTGTRSLDRMGGLLKRLPLTGTLFLAGAMGAAAIPPFNGFASEFLLLMSVYRGAVGGWTADVWAASMLAALALLAVTGGLAVAAYVKAFGFAFLGNPRGAGAASSSGERRRLLIPHFLLAAAAVALAGASPWVLAQLSPTAGTLVRLWRPAATVGEGLATVARTADVMEGIFTGCWLLAGCVVLSWVVRRLLLAGKAGTAAPTWDCGYAAPDSRMQYTSTSFARPLAENFRALTRLEDRDDGPRGLFPGAASFFSTTPGVEKAAGFSQLFRLIAALSGRVRVLQAGRVQLYLLYMAVVLVILLLWKL